MTPSSRPTLPSADELAAFRAWLAGMDARAAVERFLPDRREAGQSSRAILGRIRRELMAAARVLHRADLASVLATRPRSRVAKAVPAAIETLRAVRPPVPTVSDEVAQWLPARIAIPLRKSGVQTLSELALRIASNRTWWKSLSGIGRTGATQAERFLHAHPSLAHAAAGTTVIASPELVPWEHLRTPRDLDGSQGTFRAPCSTCVLAAKDDYQAVQAWLSLQESEATRRAYRKEAERLMLWAIVERSKPLSSLVTEDAIAYRAFLRRPTPRDRWVGPTASRSSAAWRPFQGPLSARSVAYAMQVLNAMFRWLIEQRYVLANPFSGVKVRGAERRQAVDARRAFDEHEWALIRRVAEFTAVEDAFQAEAHARLLFLLDFSYATGLRAGELVRAKLGDIETDGRGARWLHVVGKGSKEGKVVLPPLAWAALERYLRARGLSNRPSAWVPQHPLVASIEGSEAITATRLWRVMKRFFEIAAEELSTTSPATAERARRASPHWMRHTHATHGLARGIDVAVMRDNLRHSSIAVTSTYLHADDARRANALGDAFGACCRD